MSKACLGLWVALCAWVFTGCGEDFAVSDGQGDQATGSDSDVGGSIGASVMGTSTGIGGEGSSDSTSDATATTGSADQSSGATTSVSDVATGAGATSSDTMGSNATGTSSGGVDTGGSSDGGSSAGGTSSGDPGGAGNGRGGAFGGGAPGNSGSGGASSQGGDEQGGTSNQGGRFQGGAGSQAGSASGGGARAGTSSGGASSGGSGGTAAGGSGGAGAGCDDCAFGTCCDGVCVNTDNNPNHCGSCGNHCEGDQSYCELGQCGKPACDSCQDGEICCFLMQGVWLSDCIEPVDGGTCPFGCPECDCAATGTMIGTPSGERAISELRVGDLVYSVHDHAIVAVPVLQLRKTAVEQHRVVQVMLNGGRILHMSGRHPLADGRTFADLIALAPGSSLAKVGDEAIVEARVVPYRDAFTYDILPDSDSATYFAEGVAVGSTLASPR